MIKTVGRTIRKHIKVHLLITLICLNLISLVGCLEKKTGDHLEDYGIYSNVASIISSQQQQQGSHPTANQSDFRPSNWTVPSDRLRKTKRLENYDKYRRYQEYNKYLRAKQSEDSNDSGYSTKNDFQFRRRSDLDDDYYSPAYYPAANQHHYGLVYPPPPAVQPSLISLPGPTVLATSSPAYYHHTYRKYRPSASRSYYHRIYPASSTLRRRLASSSASYDTPDAVSYHATPSAYQSYYYGSGLASNPHVPYTSTATGYPNTHGLAQVAEHDLHHHEDKEVHSLLPIITVIGIGAFMVSGL